jgi:predicted nicotinamide N-methyase
LQLEPVPSLPGTVLYAPHPGSGLWRLAGSGDRPPYWAYLWAGGAVLGRFILDHPEIVQGRRVLDLGAGSGIVGIAAARAGAAAVLAAEIDPNGQAALRLNAEANDVDIAVTDEDLAIAGSSLPAVDLVLVGDLFYEPALARRVTALLERCVDAGMEVLVGDPGRAHLPQSRLTTIAQYRVPDVGAPRAAAETMAAVFRFGRPLGAE